MSADPSDATQCREYSARSNPLGPRLVLSYAVDFHPSGRWLVYANNNNLHICDLPAGKDLVPKLSPGASYLCSARFTADGRRLVSGNGDGTVRVWEIADGAFQEEQPAEKP